MSTSTSTSVSMSNPFESQQARFRLDGKLAIVTGGHRGIGNAICKGLANFGADIIVLDRQGPLKSDVPYYIEQIVGRRYTNIICDLNDTKSITTSLEQMLQIITKEWKREKIDVLINNAGVALLANLTDMSNEIWNKTMNINLNGPMQICRELIPYMIDNNGNGGSIINISSVAAQSALLKHSAYSCSKAALEMLTKCITAEWTQKGIRANVVAPTVVLTKMGKQVWEGTKQAEEMLTRLPAGRFAEPHEVADVVVFLASDAAKMINGSVIHVDGGFNAI